jgi:hypothetical protein
MMSYSSAKSSRLYQLNPLPYRNQPFKLKSWTDTVAGYMNEADKLARCVMRNKKLMKRDYPWTVTINIEKELTPTEVKSVWQKVCRKLKSFNIIALWVREPSRKNHVNYHLVVSNAMTQAELDRVIELSMPGRKEINWHKQVDPVKNQWSYARYIVKAKTGAEVNGKWVRDKHRRKRLMFKSNLNLRKLGTIGRFWMKPKKKLWDEIKETEQRIGEGLKKPFVKELAQHVFEMFGEQVPLQRIERSFGYFADAPSTRQWIDQLFGELVETGSP